MEIISRLWVAQGCYCILTIICDGPPFRLRRVTEGGGRLGRLLLQPQCVARAKLNLGRCSLARKKSAAVVATIKREINCCQFMPARYLQSSGLQPVIFLVASAHPHNCRSNERNWIASETWSPRIFSAPARSAMVRATFKMRS